MRKLVIGLLIGFFVAFIPALAISEDSGTKSFFNLADAYIQAKGCKPYHLMHEPIAKQFFDLGNEFRFWIDLETEKEGESPCSKRDEKPCTMKLEVLGKDMDGKDAIWEVCKMDSRIEADSKSGWSIPGHISRKIAFGDARIRFRLVKEEKTHYLFEIPIEIR